LFTLDFSKNSESYCNCEFWHNYGPFEPRKYLQ
jgi:hypothetical protein